MSHTLALVGIGKIARDQHLPSIADDPRWSLGCTVSRNATVDGVPSYGSVPEMLVAEPGVEVVSLALPPVPRFEAARAALEAGRHVMLEKPPAMTLGEAQILADLADRRGLTLFATWHSRHAHSVPAAKAFLEDKTLESLKITWKEDVRRWHPGQDWIWSPGGMGVFDPGINALSILTEILPTPVSLETAILDFPANRGTPVAAELRMRHPVGAEVTASFDWLHEGRQSWDIEARTNAGCLTLSDGGARMFLDGEEHTPPGGDRPTTCATNTAAFTRAWPTSWKPGRATWTCRRWCWLPMPS